MSSEGRSRAEGPSDRRALRGLAAAGVLLAVAAALVLPWLAWVPDDEMAPSFLGADARDAAVDSRWWGPVPLEALQGVVALRVGVPGHPWRGWTAGRP